MAKVIGNRTLGNHQRCVAVIEGSSPQVYRNAEAPVTPLAFHCRLCFAPDGEAAESATLPSARTSPTPNTLLRPSSAWIGPPLSTIP